jgi:branched-chain amino acid transport system ATP-binding protein
MREENTLLKIINLEVSYNQIHALKGVNAQIFPNEVVVLVGSNGAGKSTLLNTIIGLVKAQKGEIYFKGKEILGLKSYEIVSLGITLIPEGRKVFPDQTVDENLSLGAYSKRRIWKKAEIKKRRESFFAMFPILKQRKDQMAGTLSGGEQQMLALARGLMSGPDMLMVDEPSLGLAPILQKEVFKALQQLRSQGKTIFLVEQMAWAAL